MMKEIGSEFWDIPISNCNNGLFPDSVKWFISGRSALTAIVKEINVQSVAIPFWCCESMISPFVNEGVHVLFYDKEIPQSDALLVMDYFGYKSRSVDKDACKIIIRDVTHSIFSNYQYGADYYYGSLRKWAGFWTGGFGWGFNKQIKYCGSGEGYCKLRDEAMRLKKEYINSVSFEGKSIDKKYIDIFLEAERELESNMVRKAAQRDIEYAKLLDADFIRKRRRENAQVLLDAFAEIAVFPELGKEDCPLFVPIRVKRRDELKSLLVENSMFCPSHWPISKLHSLDYLQKQFYDEEISLVCDQRYSTDDMKRMISIIKGNWSKVRK